MSSAAILSRKSRRDLRRRRSQVIAVALTVMIGIAVFLLSGSLASNLTSSYDLTYERTSFADLWVSGGPADLDRRLASRPGVELVERRTSADVGVRFTDRPIRTRLVGFGPETSLNTLVVTDGAGLEPGGQGVVVEQHTADHFGIGPGDLVDIAGVGEAPVVGVAVSPEWLWVAPSQQEVVVDPDEFGVVFAPEALAAQAAPGRTQLVAAVAGNDPELSVAAATAAVSAGAGEVLTRETHPSNQALQGDLEGFEQLAVLFPILFLAAAGLATGVLLSRLITQQRAEIGMLRANGYSVRSIQRHYASYGVIVSLLGAIPALPLGVLGGFAATGAYTDFLGIPFAAREVQLAPLAASIVFAVVVGGVSGGIAARRATAVDPASAMRPGGGSVVGRRSPLERLLPAGVPNWLRMSVRNIGRAPGRAATTALGVILALMLTMTALVLNDTIDDIFASQFTETDSRGLVVTVAADAEIDRVAEAVAALDGVAVVERHLELGASLLAGGGARAERLLVFAPATELHGFSDIGGLPADGIVLSAGAASELGIDVGDLVEVRATDGTFGQVEVAAVVTESFAGSSYLSTNAWAAIGGSPPDSLAVGLENRDAHDDVRASVASLTGVERISDQIATADRIEELLAASRFFVGVILLLAVAMAVALIFNALAVTIGERETEVATLQANGVGRRWVRRSITTENLVTVLLGVAPGIVIGWVLAGVFVGQFSTDQFILDPVLRPRSLAVAGALLVACALVAQVPGLRRLDRLDLATKVRERAL